MHHKSDSLILTCSLVFRMEFGYFLLKHGNPVRLKEVFNHTHSSNRNVIEWCFEILKNN
jgi:hypothetical protein